MTRDVIPELMLLFTHSLTALLASLFHDYIQPLPTTVKVLLLILYAVVIFLLYRAFKKVINLSADAGLRRELAEQQQELAKQQRYNHLRARMLEVVAEFVKERYEINYDLTFKLNKLDEEGNLKAKAVKEALDHADRTRVEKVKEALKSLSSALREDVFKKPATADAVNTDLMKVSFYAVEDDPDEPGQKALVPKARHYPNEGAPKTRKFKMSEGVAGLVWQDRTVIICENGGEDNRFKDMRSAQRAEYASMICLPTILDITAYKYSDLYGVLTLDSRIRRGYFEQGKEEFWADLLQPISNILIYARDSSRLIAALNKTVDRLACADPAATVE